MAETLEWRKLGKPGILSHTPVEDTAMATPQGPARLPGNSSRPSEEGDPLSPSRWTEIQWDDESQGPPVCEDMAPLPVVGGMDMEEPLWKAVCWYLSAPWVCALCPGPPPGPVPFRLRKRFLSLGFKCLPHPPSAARPHLKALFVGNTWCEGGQPLRRRGASTFSVGRGLLRKEPGGPRQSLGSVRALPTTPEGWALTSPSQTPRLPLPHGLRPSNPKSPPAFLPKLPQGGR